MTARRTSAERATCAIGLRRRLAAWVLLGVFVPMLVVTLGHRHELMAADGVVCVDCAHHVPHGGHVQAGGAAVDDCPLCQLSGASYVAALVATVVMFAVPFIARGGQLVPAVVGRKVLLRGSRAPPVLML